MPLGVWGVMRSEDASDGAGSFIWEEGARGTVDLS